MKRWLNLFKANLIKEYLELKRYLPNTIALAFTFYIVFLGMFLGIQFFGEATIQEITTQHVIVNYVIWFLGIMVMQNIGYEITNEAMRGTLEQLAMSPMGMWRIMVTRLVSLSILYFVIISGLLFLSMATARQWLNLDVITILPILFLTLLSMFGVGFMIAGLSVIVKQIHAFLQIFQFILMGLTFVPLSVAPYLKFAPFVKGVDLIRHVMIYNAGLFDFTWGDYLFLGINTIVYFGLGLFVFLGCERFAMKKGLLAHY
ncbi:ABC transporter permease [Siminovitchia sp. FSL H7-0308]|uniref:ABC-2 type transport system permease protein n=1 Tax=Siminovitchia thermophila TaxID=1245522 RepID=A0ABS2R262_9BACI|nr:ABC transporter [Siminovitchia thermophila]MBM7713654.1 ABC-2 type transport system permease protein [Siminovitchia thermophila]ONK21881.1 ABC transporter [Bacillus sp. VT-16-64]